jgi:lactate dehydrogenase-like 2-hydroxyacid dehydrogenase
MRDRVFVAQPITEAALDIIRQEADVTVYPYLDRQITEDELTANVKRNDWLFIASDNIVPAAVINANPAFKGIAASSSRGLFVDIAAATARKLPVFTADPAEYTGDGVDYATRGAVSLATADLTIGMLVSLAYRIVEADRYTRAGHFKQEQTLALMGIGCPGKTAGLIGLGKVAHYMVPRLRAFAMNVLYTKRNRLSAEEERAQGLEWTSSLDDLLARSDFVCVECDCNASTHKLIGARELGLMKRTAYLINTGRGRIIDEPELIRALQNGTIAGAGLDVFYDEPPHTYDPHVPDALRKLDNVILAPHNGGATGYSRGAKQAGVARAIVAMIKGKRAPGLLNPEIYG